MINEERKKKTEGKFVLIFLKKVDQMTADLRAFILSESETFLREFPLFFSLIITTIQSSELKL